MGIHLNRRDRILLFLVAIPFLYLVGFFAWYLISTNLKKHALKHLPNAEEVAGACRGLLESMEDDSHLLIVKASDGDYIDEDTRNDFDLPEVLEDLRPNYLSVEPYSVLLEFHGGQDHYGLRLRPPQRDGNTTGTWVLSYYDETMSKELYVLP